MGHNSLLEVLGGLKGKAQDPGGLFDHPLALTLLRLSGGEGLG